MQLTSVYSPAPTRVRPYALAPSQSERDKTPTLQRSALRYLGGKWRLAPWILQHLPTHLIYVEPYAGAFSVGLRKPAADVEVFNDLNPALVNFFQVLQRTPAELVATLDASPKSLAEFERCKVVEGDALEQARRFYLHAQLSYSSGGGRWCSGTSEARLKLMQGQRFEYLYTVSDRLATVKIQQGSAVDAIAAYDSPDTLFYVDPPYVQSVRGSKDTRHIQGAPRRQYAHEMTDDDHRQLAEALHQVSGSVVLSGYRSGLYNELFADWRRVEKPACTGSRGQRVECLWVKVGGERSPAVSVPRPAPSRRYRARGRASGWIETRVGNTRRKRPSLSHYYRWDSPQGRVTEYICADRVAAVSQMLAENRPALEVLRFVMAGRKVTGVTARVLGAELPDQQLATCLETSN